MRAHSAKTLEGQNRLFTSTSYISEVARAGGGTLPLPPCRELSRFLQPLSLFVFDWHCFSSFPFASATANSPDPAMAPKKSKFPPTTFFGQTKMTLAMLQEMENQGILTPGLGRVPLETDTYAKPREDEVVVFKDFFPAGLRFPLDPAVVDIFARYGVFLHHMTPNSFAHVNLFMWLWKTCHLAPTPENFARVMRVHYQPKSISVRGSDGVSSKMEPQYGCYTFAFQHTAPSPVGA